MRITNRAIPENSVVVVVGANGYIAVETCEKLLQAGYRVRGIVRDVNKHRDWMNALFNDKWPGKFELVQVEDFEASAFDEAFRGASDVIYPSMPIIFNPSTSKVHGPLIKGVLNTLESAARANVQRYVLGSSSKAVSSTVYNSPAKLGSDTFNQAAIAQAKNGPEEATFERMLAVYSAGRALAELTFWDWVRENEPPFVANCVVPDGQFGRVLDMRNLNVGAASSTGQLQRTLKGEWEEVGLELAFLTDNERIFAYSVNRTWNDMRHKVRELFPDRPSWCKGRTMLSREGTCQPPLGQLLERKEILREIGQPGFTSEDQVIRNFVASVYP
ncbi:putative aldehyde reductase 2 [Aspergillus heterothallicus]